MADELMATDTFAERLSVNSRSPVEVNSSTESVYRCAAAGAAPARSKRPDGARRPQPTQKWQRGEMYMLPRVCRDRARGGLLLFRNGILKTSGRQRCRNVWSRELDVRV